MCEKVKEGSKVILHQVKRVSGVATSKFWEKEATDGIGEDVTLPELVQIMKWDHARKPHQSRQSPQVYPVLWNNKLPECLPPGP